MQAGKPCNTPANSHGPSVQLPYGRHGSSMPKLTKVAHPPPPLRPPQRPVLPTHPKPRDLPLVWSTMICASTTLPKLSKCCRNISVTADIDKRRRAAGYKEKSGQNFGQNCGISSCCCCCQPLLFPAATTAGTIKHVAHLVGTCPDRLLHCYCCCRRRRTAYVAFHSISSGGGGGAAAVLLPPPPPPLVPPLLLLLLL